MSSLKPFMKTAFALSTLITAASATTYGIAGYWGQGGDAEGTLGAYCTNTKADIVILSVISAFGTGASTPELNLSSHCDGEHCTEVGEDILLCQSLGKKVLLSLGGATETYGLTSDSQGSTLAADLYDEYYSGTGSTFGVGVKVDGFDFDIELDAAGADFYPSVADTLRAQDTTGDMILSASPQCPYPDSNLNDLLTSSDINYAFIQYYNNPSCAVGADGFNFDTWNSATFFNAGIELFLGLYSSPDISGSGYVSSYQTLKDTITSLKGDNRFGGVSFWTGPYALSNDGLLDEPYEIVVYDLLNPTVSSTTSSSTSTSAAVSSTTSVSVSAASSSVASSTSASSTSASSTSASSTSASSTSASSTSASSTSASSTSDSPSTSSTSISSSSLSSSSTSASPTILTHSAWSNSSSFAASTTLSNTALGVATITSSASSTEGQLITGTTDGRSPTSPTKSATDAPEIISADLSSIVTVVDGVTITMPCPCEETKSSHAYTHSHSHSSGGIAVISVASIAVPVETGANLNAESASAGEVGSIVIVTAVPTETVTTECSSSVISTEAAYTSTVSTLSVNAASTEAISTNAVSTETTPVEAASDSTVTAEAVSTKAVSTGAASIETTEITTTYSTETVEITEVITIGISSATHTAVAPVESAGVASSVPVVGAGSYTSASVLGLATIFFSVILCL